MRRFLKYTIYVNLVVSVLSFFMAYNFWVADRQRAYIFLFLGAITGFNFFFRKRYYRKFEEHKQEHNS